ncbi:hypothetical protein B0O99DRAFT_683640 [Bisporella sp. PMI_857]|nr:hypothetical protein B0O99DRAFT_683640 [Bisporella sp. PMI_857]
MTEPVLPIELERLFSTFQNEPARLIEAFMPVFCDLVEADRIFVSPRDPHTRVCTTFKWRRNESVPWPAIPTGKKVRNWIVEDKWEDEDPLFRAALNIQPSIYVEDLQKAANEGILNLEFETSYMFHSAFIHGHAHWPPLPLRKTEPFADEARLFYGSVQPAVFHGSRIWSEKVHDLMEKCLVRIAPAMKAHAGTAPSLAEFDNA